MPKSRIPFYPGLSLINTETIYVEDELLLIMETTSQGHCIRFLVFAHTVALATYHDKLSDTLSVGGYIVSSEAFGDNPLTIVESSVRPQGISDNKWKQLLDAEDAIEFPTIKEGLIRIYYDRVFDRDWIIPRDGQRPIKTAGLRIIHISGEDGMLAFNWKRWHKIDVYFTYGRKFIVSISYNVERKYNQTSNHTAICTSEQAVADALESYDPLCSERGYPSGAKFEEKQKQLEADIIAVWRSQVAEALCELPLAAEVIQ